MKKRIVFLCVFALVASMFATQALSNGRTEDPIGVAVSPQLLNLDTVQSGYVTVHTAISYRSVATSTVRLNGIPARLTFADSCGNLVAKFTEQTVEAVVSAPTSVLTLTGLRLDGTPFEGSDTVRVR